VVRIRTALDESGSAAYRIFALRVGVSRRAPRDVFIKDSDLPRRIEVAFSFWVLQGAGRVILVDTGFTSKTMIRRWGVSDHRPPSEALASIGLRAEQVTDVIITHAHWDHVGGLSHFPSAKIWISKAELKAIRARNKGGLPRAYRRAEQEGRLNVLSGIAPVAPSVVVVPVGLHSPGFQYVVVRSADRTWVIASDIAPLWANFEQRKTTGRRVVHARILAIQDAMLELTGGDISRVIPGHEPSVFSQGATVELTRDRPDAPVSRP
jgi:glyoxylase-like metal-dependent hydrolase (beta-lactamase superfamily II)